MTTLALLLFATIPHDAVTRNRCEVIEANIVIDSQGSECFRQFIFWEHDSRKDCERVIAWRVQKGNAVTRDLSTGDYVLRMKDGDYVFREIRAPILLETAGDDPELIDRDVFPKERRKELSNPQWRRWVK